MTTSRVGRWIWVAALFCASACAPAPPPPPGQPATAAGLSDPVPPGFGSLRQDDITLILSAGALLLKVTPLEEWVIRLTAPDTHRRLAELAAQHRAAAGATSGGRSAALFLVSFFSEQPEVAFQPQDLELVNRGRLYRPLAIRGITGGWGTQRLGQRETQMAVYAFDPDIDLTLDLTAEYGDERTAEWTRILQRLQAEAARARARAGAGRP